MASSGHDDAALPVDAHVRCFCNSNSIEVLWWHPSRMPPAVFFFLKGLVYHIEIAGEGHFLDSGARRMRRHGSVVDLVILKNSLSVSFMFLGSNPKAKNILKTVTVFNMRFGPKLES